MRIAVVTTSWPDDAGDAAGHFVRTHARQLAGQGDRVVVVRPRPGGAFGWPGATARVRARPLRAFEVMQWTLGARQCIARLDVQRVVAHWCIPCAFPIGIATRGRLDIISHGGDVRLLASAPASWRRTIVGMLARRAMTWTFASERLRAELAGVLDRATGDALDRIACVEAPPIDMPPADELRASVEACREALGAVSFAVCVARLVRSKRVDRIIEHVAADPERRPLVVVGDGPERLRLERFARSLHADVRFVGSVARPEALGWIGAADVLIHASEAEGLSTVLREARWLGTRVLQLGPRVGAGGPRGARCARSSDGGARQRTLR